MKDRGIEMNKKLVYFLIIILPLPLILAELFTQTIEANLSVWNIVSVTLGGVAFSTLCVVLFLGGRPRFLNLQLAQQLHRILAVVGIVALVLHNQAESFVDNPHETHLVAGPGSAAQIVFLVIAGISLLFLATKWLLYTPTAVQKFMEKLSFIKYDWIKWIHHLNLVGIILMTIHVIFINALIGETSASILFSCYTLVAVSSYIPVLYRKFKSNNARVISSENLSRSMVKLTFAFLRPEKIENGQVVWIRIKGNEHPFTIVEVKEDWLSIVYKKEGAFTKLLSSFQEGALFYVSKAFNKPLEIENSSVFVAGGSGITPFLSTIEKWRKNPKFPLTLYWSVRTNDELVFDAYFKALQQTEPNFHYYPFVTRENDKKHLTDEQLKLNKDLKEATCYISASPKTAKMFKEMLKNCRVNKIVVTMY